jgi:hypothetical protein
MLRRRAQVSRASSMPAKGNTGQKPSRVSGKATDKEAAAAVSRKIRAPRGLREQWGEISILVISTPPSTQGKHTTES